MVGWYSRDLLCKDCTARWNEVVDREDRDKVAECPSCGKMSGRRTISAPMVLMASYPDGTRRFDPRVKEAARLQVEAASKSGSTKADLQKEINKLRKAEKK